MAKKSEKAKATETAGASVSKFSKEQLLQSRRYCERRDLIVALLKDGEQYSPDEVDALIDNFMKGKVE